MAVLPPIPPGFLKAANCLKGCVRTAAAGKGIFMPYDDPIMYPWVEAWIPGENFRLSMGNESSRTTESQIVGFNFGISNGLGVKIEVVDESGGQFYRFFQRMNNSNRAKTDRMIHFRWGYISQNTQGEIIRSSASKFVNPPGSACGVNSNRIVSGQPIPDPNSRRMISAEHALFIQDIECQATTSSCFKFIISGLDMHQPMMSTVDNRTFGSDRNPIFLTNAIRELFKPYLVDVDFVEIDSTGNRRPMRFYVPPNSCPTAELQQQVQYCGPCSKWNSSNRTPIEAATTWMNEVFTQDRRGIIRFWEDTPTGQKLVFARSNRDPINPFDQQRVLGTYIVGGAGCSSVISFQPNFKFMFQQAATGAARPSGNAESPNKGVGQKQMGLNAGPGANPAAMTNLTNAGMSMQPVVGQRSWQWFVTEASSYILEAAAHNNYANSTFFLPIESELKLQGDVAYEWPYLNNGYALNVVCLNPFRPRQTFLGVLGDVEWFSGDIGTFSLSTDQCNQILTNSNWRIMGISHDIRSGAYYTTIKLALDAPGIDLPPGNLGLGGVPGGFKFKN